MIERGKRAMDNANFERDQKNFFNPIAYGGGGGAFWPAPSDCQP